MNTTLAKWMTLYISITIMFTPLLAWLNGLHKQSVDTVLHHYLKKAAIEGYVTNDILTEIEDTLVEKYNFDVKNIVVVTGTASREPRGANIEGEITIKNTPLFVIDLFNQGPENYTKEASIMSEYME